MAPQKWRLEQLKENGWRLITDKHDEPALILYTQKKYWATLDPYAKDKDDIADSLIWDFEIGHPRPFDSLEEAAEAAYNEFIRRIDLKMRDWPFIGEGYGAFKQSIAFTDNPYPSASAKHELWAKGWTMAGLNPFEE